MAIVGDDQAQGAPLIVAEADVDAALALLDDPNVTDDALLVNVRALVDALNKAKPSGAKGVYLKKVSMSSTMGPGFTVDLGSLSA